MHLIKNKNVQKNNNIKNISSKVLLYIWQLTLWEKNI